MIGLCSIKLFFTMHASLVIRFQEVLQLILATVFLIIAFRNTFIYLVYNVQMPRNENKFTCQKYFTIWSESNRRDFSLVHHSRHLLVSFDHGRITFIKIVHSDFM